MVRPACKVVRTVLLDGGVADALAPGSLVVDMSSSAPAGSVALSAELAKRDLSFIDAPVSGGVRRAVDGSLTIMVGGDAGDLERARPVLEHLGKSIVPTGPVGSGHAVKALNNYVSAAGLVAAIEAVEIGARFGIDPGTIVDVLNTSTGRNNSTENKLKQFVLSETFSSGFSMALLAKDIETAADLARGLPVKAELLDGMAALWSRANTELGPGRDHTEIARLLRG